MNLTLLLMSYMLPAFLGLAHAILYRKEYKWLKRFYWRMTMLQSARKLYCIVLFAILVFLNWLFYMTMPNYAVAISAFMTFPFMFYRIADGVLHRLHEDIPLNLVLLMLVLIGILVIYIHSIIFVVFIVFVASRFYPSEAILIMTTLDNFPRSRNIQDHVISQYYYFGPELSGRSSENTCSENSKQQTNSNTK